MKIGFIQFTPKLGNKNRNIEKINKFVSKTDASLLVLPEMCTTGYMFKNKSELLKFAEEIPNGSTVKKLIKIAKKNNCCLVFGMPEISKKKIFNTAVVVGPKGFITKYQKTHLFLKEKLLFNSGETKPTLFKWKNNKIGLGICYDYMFPEYWRKLALKKVNLFCNIANFVFDYGFKMMQARSIENGVFSITVNRVGKERGQIFKGKSEIVDNRGNILKKGGKKEEVCILDLNLSKAKNKKWNKYNDLMKDRRPEIYY